MNTLILDRMSVEHSKKFLLNNVSAVVPGGQVVAVLGPNGAGKSTLLQAIANQISFSGNVQYKCTDEKKHSVGFLPQNAVVNTELTVLETMLLGFYGELGYFIESHRIQSVMKILNEFNLSELANQSMRSLSGGQQQLVLLAQRMLRQPNLLILDESTSALDTHRQLQVFQYLREYVLRTGALVLVSIHDLNLASRYSDSVLLLNKGNLLGMGTFEQTLTPDVIKQVYKIEVELVRSKTGVLVIIPL